MWFRLIKKLILFSYFRNIIFHWNNSTYHFLCDHSLLSSAKSIEFIVQNTFVVGKINDTFTMKLTPSDCDINTERKANSSDIYCHEVKFTIIFFVFCRSKLNETLECDATNEMLKNHTEINYKIWIFVYFIILMNLLHVLICVSSIVWFLFNYLFIFFST